MYSVPGMAGRSAVGPGVDVRCTSCGEVASRLAPGERVMRVGEHDKAETRVSASCPTCGRVLVYRKAPG